jgi:hypothetical protein
VAFDIFEYIGWVERRLGALPSCRQTAFAAWCSEPLVREFGQYLAERLGQDPYLYLQRKLDDLWTELERNTPASRDSYVEAERLCAAANWHEHEVAVEDAFVNDGAVELLGSLRRTFEHARTHNTRCAAEAAERVINRVDYELTMIRGVEKPFEHALMKDEIEMQSRMLAHLAENSVTEVTRSLFRF